MGAPPMRVLAAIPLTRACAPLPPQTTTRSGHNEFFCRSPVGVQCGAWTHCLALYERATSTLRLYMDGETASTKQISGDFVPCARRPRLGQNPEWHDRSVVGEVAFARIQHAWPCAPTEADAFAAELADQRFTSLGDAEPLEVMRAAPFLGAPNWTIRWLAGNTEPVTVDRRGRFVVFGHLYQLLATSPVTFRWADGTVQTMQTSTNDAEGAVHITWGTTNPHFPTIYWDRRG